MCAPPKSDAADPFRGDAVAPVGMVPNSKPATRAMPAMPGQTFHLVISHLLLSGGAGAPALPGRVG
jgi:hypothetical protein